MKNNEASFSNIISVFRKYSVSENVAFVKMEDVRAYFANNNSRRLRYRKAPKRGCLNKNNVTTRRFEKQIKRGYKKRPVIAPWQIDEFRAIIPQDEASIFVRDMIGRARKYCEPCVRLGASPRTDIAVMPYDFDAEKNALVKSGE